MLKNEHYLLSQREYLAKALTKVDKASELLQQAGMVIMNLEHFRFHSHVIDSQVEILGALIEQLECRQNEIEEEIEQELTIANEMRCTNEQVQSNKSSIHFRSSKLWLA